MPEWPDYIEIKSQEQIDDLARACQLARHVLLIAGQSLKVIFALEICGAKYTHTHYINSFDSMLFRLA